MFRVVDVWFNPRMTNVVSPATLYDTKFITIQGDSNAVVGPDAHEQWDALDWEKPMKEQKNLYNSHTGTK